MMLWHDVKDALDHDDCGPSSIYCSTPVSPPVTPVPLDSPFSYLLLAMVGVVVYKKLKGESK